MDFGGREADVGAVAELYAQVYSLRPSDEPGGGDPGSLPFGNPSATPQDDLAYRVEIWDRDEGGVEQVLAGTVSASIRYAALYAATRAVPARVVLLPHHKAVLHP